MARMGMVAGLALAGLVGVAAAETDPLAMHRWRSRVLVISASTADDPQARAQRLIAAAAEADMDERSLVTVEAYGQSATATAVRRKLGLPETAFRAVLVGKDGDAKIVAADPITAASLIRTIDAMPMRRDEMRR